MLKKSDFELFATLEDDQVTTCSYMASRSNIPPGSLLSKKGERFSFQEKQDETS